MKLQLLTLTCIAMALISCANKESVHPERTEAPVIEAYIVEPAETRACIETEITEGTTSVQVLWMANDELGVFTEAKNNVKYGKNELKTNQAIATFTTSETVTGTPEYAYFPYSSEAGIDKTALTGEVPANQGMNLLTGRIPGDYKMGKFLSGSASAAKFSFTHLFSIARVVVDATGTDLEGENLQSVAMTVTRSGAYVPVCGGFTFSVVDGSYTLGTTSNTLTFNWMTSPVLRGVLLGYATLFPEIKSGDNLAFTITTSGHVATLNVTAKVDIVGNYIYTFPLTLANLTMAVSERTDVGRSGTFTVADYNVKGSSSTDITSKIVADEWDIIGFCEDGGKIEQKLSGYSYGSATSTLGDLLGFATRNGAATFSDEDIVKYEHAYGGLLDGANTTVDKGFRYYLVTLTNGIQVDVYITHMNTYSNSGTGHIDAQHNQLKQLAEYIASHRNKRPVIFMGDTNCRYTRHDFQTYFWSILDKEYLTINDPWVDFYWKGVYPAYYEGAKSLVVEDATGTNPDTDIIYSSQMGEVVDKVIYINDSEAAVQIKANGYLRDMSYNKSNGEGLSDHYPIVVEFYYEERN